MDFSEPYVYLLVLQFIFHISSMAQADPTSVNPNLFREYIGAEGKNVTFSDVPINSNVEFHFILSFAINYTNSSIPLPTDGYFNIYWDTENLTPSAVSQIKAQHSNVKVAMSLAGDTVNGFNASFNPRSINSWVGNAIDSVSKIVKEYNLDGIDIDYEHFISDPDTFAECIGRLLQYQGGKILVSFGTDHSGGLSPKHGFFRASRFLKSAGKLHGIFIWSADDSKKHKFRYEKQAQDLLAT